MSVPSRMQPWFAELRGNARLRWGLWAIVAILWLYALLVLRDEVPRQAEAYRGVARQLARTQAAASDAQWTARRDEAVAARAAMENRLWRASTIGLAQASFHDWLARAAQQSALQRTQISVAALEEDAGAGSGMWKVTARMSFDFAPQGLYPFLGRLAANDKKIVVETVNVRSLPVPRAELVLVAYFLAPAAVLGSARENRS